MGVVRETYSCFFQIKNKVNGKTFIGSSHDLPAILNRFRAELKMGSCRHVVLQQEWKQFGPEAFEFEELEILKPLDAPGYHPADDLHFLEALWTEKLTPYDEKGYNKVPSTGTQSPGETNKDEINKGGDRV